MANAKTASIDDLIVRIGTGKQAPDARTALRAIPAAEVVPCLVRAFSDPRPKVRGAAYELSTSTPARARGTPLANVVAGLADVDPGVRLSVLLALNRGWGNTNAAVYAPRREEVRAGLAPRVDDPDKRVKSQAAIIWKRLGL